MVKFIQRSIENVDLTYSTGINVSGTPSFWIFNSQIGVSVDAKGNVAVQSSLGGGICTGDLGVSATVFKV